LSGPVAAVPLLHPRKPVALWPGSTIGPSFRSRVMAARIARAFSRSAARLRRVAGVVRARTIASGVGGTAIVTGTREAVARKGRRVTHGVFPDTVVADGPSVPVDDVDLASARVPPDDSVACVSRTRYGTSEHTTGAEAGGGTTGQNGCQSAGRKNTRKKRTHGSRDLSRAQVAWNP
jgi:hypothetical protein